ncbi:MAG: Fe(3+) dicitrate transport ATP-binding protein FecE, partial [Chlamydiae bacterium]|nr:Fe(3+) dicitrate transport ATP-binding protein FecE [Chlamydiota bacterium]
MLKVENLSFNEMIQNICLMFTPGTITGILGPNGSGKTTFLKTLKKIWTPTSGQVTWNGESLHALSREKMSEVMSLVPQNPQVTFGFTVREFLEMGSYPAVSMNPQLYQQTLTLLDLEMLEDRPITELSGGERQRAYIARSLITEAPVMMLDEPIANLDICHQQSILKLLKEFAQSGKTVI